MPQAAARDIRTNPSDHASFNAAVTEVTAVEAPKRSARGSTQSLAHQVA